MYEVRFLPQAEKYFKKIKDKSLMAAFHQALQAISKDPYAGHEKKGDLAGIYGCFIALASFPESRFRPSIVRTQQEQFRRVYSKKIFNFLYMRLKRSRIALSLTPCARARLVIDWCSKNTFWMSSRCLGKRLSIAH